MVIALAAFVVEGSQVDMEVSIPLLSAHVRTWSKTHCHSMARPVPFSNRDVGLFKGEVYCFFVIERPPKSKMLYKCTNPDSLSLIS